MSYEYSSESSNLDYPNPFKVENLFRFAAGVLLLAGALLLLMSSRGNLSRSLSWGGAVPLLIGVLLLVYGITYVARAMAQLRFFFGRGEPISLAPDLMGEDGGLNTKSAWLKETMRQNALTFEEPRGALNGLLYSVLPQLIYAPAPIQASAQRQFQSALAMGVTLISLLVAWLGFGASRQSGWLGLFYFCFSAFLLLRPLELGAQARADFGARGLIVLILVAIFGPVLIPFVAGRLPDISWLSLNGQTFFLLLAALAAVALFFVALTKQLMAPPSTTMGCETRTLSFNAHPKQLMDECERELQRNWVGKIPNRRYIKVSPLLSGSGGVFSGDVMEETQPFSPSTQPRLDLAMCLRTPRYQYLTWLNGLGLALTAIAVIALVVFGNSVNAQPIELGLLSYASFGVAMLLVAHFCFKAGHILWARFDFLSELMWIEMQGNHTSAKFDYGNQFTDHIKTEKDIVNIETMTLRVWVAQIDTVSFGKGGPRFLVGMRGLPDKASYLCAHLSQFVANQSMIIAPSSGADLQKIAALKAMNQFSATPGAAAPVLDAGVPLTAMARPGAPPATLVCAACHSAQQAHSRFCSQCGAVLGAA